MRNKTMIAMGVAGALLAASPIAWQAYANDNPRPPAKVEAKADPLAADLNSISKEGLIAMRSVYTARGAINDGDYDAAKASLKAAKDALTQVSKDNPALTVKEDVKVGNKVVSTSQENVQADLVPISGQYKIIEDFSASPEKTAHITKAHEHLKKGDTRSAMEELKLADTDIVFQRIDMPLTATTQHVDTAIGLLNDGKYHDANLALKAAEDGLQYNTVSIVAPVKPGQSQPSKG